MNWMRGTTQAISQSSNANVGQQMGSDLGPFINICLPFSKEIKDLIGSSVINVLYKCKRIKSLSRASPLTKLDCHLLGFKLKNFS